MTSRLFIVLVVAVGLAGCGGSSSSPTVPSQPTYVLSSSELSDMLSEKVLGNGGAGVTMIEYSSLTCPHCATFQLATLPALRAIYIDTGKVKLIHRDFPVPGASTLPAAYAAAALARCAGTARYFDAVDLIYRAQGSWTSSGNPTSAMKQALAPLGIASDKMDACVASAEIRNEIDRLMTDARSSYGISATPTVVINGQKFVGASYAEIDAYLKTVVK